MEKQRKKTGSKVIVHCDLCGKELTKAGLIGHMRFKHGKDHKAPLLSVNKPSVLVSKDIIRQAFRLAFSNAPVVDKSGNLVGHFVYPTGENEQAVAKADNGLAEALTNLREGEALTVEIDEEYLKTAFKAVANIITYDESKNKKVREG